MELGLAEAKARLAELVTAAQRGERVVIIQHGEPAAELVRCRKAGGIDFDKLNAARRRLGLEGAASEWPADFDDPAFSHRVLELE
ncbi:MAG: type II toxin-antitoxin system prevent-host-death family antitoxin [Chloroflexi bacterium]|nr:type II toxin-antitoxin system prevent-host-death family antitoxin [Chloroflexota bacterium]MCY4110615.1 type II toxin-antitoxin system prevent-host-death family antitoxin [Chloroflexota bacterium]